MVALATLAMLHGVWIYLALMFGWMLAWTVPWPIQLALVLMIIAVIASRRRAWLGIRVPFVLPLGVWIAVCLLGWWREDGVIRCDDLARFRSEAKATIAIPTTRALETCHRGEVLRVQRYPRRLWEAPDGDRFIIPTQQGIGYPPQGTAVPDPILGNVCEFGSDGSRRACVGDGEYKMQVIFDSAPLDRVFVGGWGGGHGILYAHPRSAPLGILGEARTEGSTGEGYYDPDADEVALFADECTGLTRIRASDLTPLPHVHAPFCPGEAHYDPERHEGILCFAPGPLGPISMGDGTGGYLSVAFHGNPFSYRLLGTAPWGAWAYGALVWGCEFDPVNRVAWALIANLPLIAVLDYDSGRVVGTWWSEPGLRSAAFDAQRHLLYMTNFLRGDVIAINVDSGREVQRWFAGRFVRYVALSRDQRSLWATSNFGVVRIPLPEIVPSQASEAELP